MSCTRCSNTLSLHLAMASTIKTRSSLYLQGLQDGYSNEELADFREYVLDNTSCLPRSRFPQEQAQVVSKFLFFANDGRPFEEPEVWRPIHDVKLIDSWLRSLQKAGCSPSTLYNRVRALKIASRFTYATFKMEPSSGLREDLDSKLSVFNRRRKAAVGAHEGNPLPDLKALQEDVFDNESAKKRFQQVVRRAQGFQDVDAKLQRAEFLFAMRMALVLCQSSVGTRPSALYTLTTSQVMEACRQHPEDSDMVIGNAAHKTGGSRGPAIIVLGSASRRVLLDYVTYVRSRCPNAPVGDHAFVNANGRPLTPSQVNANLVRHQRSCGWDRRPVTCTDFRKAVVTELRTQERQRRGQATLDDVCLTMTHSRATSDRYYDRDLRRDAAIRTHGRIRALMQQEDQE